MATRKPLVIIGGQIQELPAADAIDSASFTGTNWTDLTDGGTTTLHSHAGGSVVVSNLVAAPQTIAADTSLIVSSYLIITSDLTISGNLMVTG